MEVRSHSCKVVIMMNPKMIGRMHIPFENAPKVGDCLCSTVTTLIVRGRSIDSVDGRGALCSFSLAWRGIFVAVGADG